MQDNDLNIEDFIKLFLDSFAGKEIKDINQIADYFERESLKFVKKNSDATFTSKQRDLMLGEFLEKVEYAKKEIDKPFLRYEKMHLDRIYEAESKGYDTSNYVVPDLLKMKLQMFEIYRPYKGELYYWEVQRVYQGFELFKQQHEEGSNIVTPIDNQWIKDIVKEKYKYYGFEEHIGLNYDFPFMEHKKGDIDFNNQKWACVNWYIRNLNTVHRDLLNNLEMLPKEKVKEQIMFAYNKQIEVFQDWDLRQGVYVEYFNSMEKLSKSLGSQTPDGYYDIYRLKWLFISSCFIKFYKVILNKYFLEQPEVPAPPATKQPTNTKPIKAKLLPTFKEMFKDHKQFDKILLIIKPLLNETGTLNVSPQGKYLQALYNDLEEKGYLNRGAYDYKQIANALNVQFSTNLGNDTFKPSNRNKGDHYKIYFNNIPSI